jgi:hypothetical protein
LLVLPVMKVLLLGVQRKINVALVNFAFFLKITTKCNLLRRGVGFAGSNPTFSANRSIPLP